jgi:hypothetical protein
LPVRPHGGVLAWNGPPHAADAFAKPDGILYSRAVSASPRAGTKNNQRCDATGIPPLARRENMKKLLAALFAALFATATIGITMVPTVAKAADMDKKDSKKKDKKDEMKK